MIKRAKLEIVAPKKRLGVAGLRVGGGNRALYKRQSAHFHCAGKIYIAHSILNSNLQVTDVIRALTRHSRGDWGNVTAKQATANKQAIDRGIGNVISYYNSETGTRYKIITTPRRHLTTVSTDTSSL
jgi:hypothetical protein